MSHSALRGCCLVFCHRDKTRNQYKIILCSVEGFEEIMSENRVNTCSRPTDRYSSSAPQYNQALKTSA